MELYYDNSKDLSEGEIIEIDEGVYNQVAIVLPNFREQYGYKFAAAPDLYEALKKLVNSFTTVAMMAGLSSSKIDEELGASQRILAKAEGK